MGGGVGRGGVGVLDAWLWTHDRATFGEDRRHWSRKTKESMRGLEGFAHRAELAATPPDTPLVYVADRVTPRPTRAAQQ